MRILYITNFYAFRNSSAAVRNNALVKGLIELGHTVDVQTIRFPEDQTSPDLMYGNIHYTDVFNWTSRQALGAKVSSNILLSSLRSIYVKLRRNTEFPDRYHNWIDKINIDKIPLNEYDLMISSSDSKTSHFVALRLKRQNPELRWIQIWGDPWYDDVNLKGYNRWRVKRAERNILSQANNVVYISAPTAEVMKKRYNDIANKIHFVPRSYFKEYKYTISSKGDFHIVYTGSIQRAHGRNLSPLVNAIDLYNKNNAKQIILDVYGSVDENVRKETNSKYVMFHGSVDVSELGGVYESSNALLYISNKAGSTQIPGKLYDYIGTSSLILCLVCSLDDGIAEYLKTLNDKCYLILNEECSLQRELPVMVEKMRNTYAPVQSFSPRVIAKEVLHIL